jgi:hypothetical protein
MSIFKEIEQKPIEYISLAISFLIGGSIYIFTSHHNFAIFLIGGSYFLWSLYHHYRRGDLQLSIVIEYLVFILFAIIILMYHF